MLKKTVAVLTLSLLIVFLLGLLVSCVEHKQSAPAKDPLVKSVQGSLYDAEVQPLSSRECGKCHIRIFYLLQTAGAKHRIKCRRCHVKFHDYKPGKTEYKDVVPKCEQCHDKPHGKELVECLGCHRQPHTPLRIPSSEQLALACDRCHPMVDREMKTFETFHTEFYCTACHHSNHGYKPECFECHMGHTDEMIMEDCLTCHPPHKAFEIVYPDDTPREVCKLCHPLAYKWLTTSNSKHSTFACTKCHPQKHRTIIECKECHQPHDKSIIENQPVCGHCHGIAHSLVIK
ncbi:MAG: hypothetical protein OEM02_10545 [Desulfobulbaceae bacterium]|nr:hypothetical protein [Desulfobulbaceae bacterium]